MSFKDDYKNQMDKIRADGYLRKKITEKIEEAEENRKPKFVFAKFAAAAICLVLAVVIAIPAVKHTANNLKSSTDKALNDADAEYYKEEIKENKPEDYSEIYEKIKEVKLQARDSETAVITDDYVAFGSSPATGGNVISEEADDAANVNGGAVLKGDSGQNTANKLTADKTHSNTTTQVEGVDEADIVKTDGEYIYILSKKNYKVRIVKAGKNPVQVNSIPMENLNYNQNLYICKDRLVAIGTHYATKSGKIETVAYIYDISNPEETEKIGECRQDGEYSDSRLIGNKLYAISNYVINNNDISEQNPRSYVPNVKCGTYDDAVPAHSIYINPKSSSFCYTVICGFDMTDGSIKGTQSILGGTYTVYCSTKNIITVGYSDAETQITRYEINDGEITHKASGKIKGGLLNQFSIDEYNDHFRFVTTEEKWVENTEKGVAAYTNITSNSLYVLNGELETVGSINGLAPDERVYSVRFMGDIAYFVTFRQVDPLFSADLSNPKEPKIIGSLKIPGFSNYLHPFSEGKLLGIGQQADENTGITGNVKLSLFDVSDPSNVKESSKKELPIHYSDALDNHKATFIDTERLLVGFNGYTETGTVYCIYGFEKGEFVKKAEIELDINDNNFRGLYIGNEFYIISEDGILVYDFTTFKPVGELYYVKKDK